MKFACKHFAVCSGCREELTEVIPAVWQEVLDFCDGMVVPSLSQGSPIHWRCRAKLATRGTKENPQIGLFKKDSHDVVPIPDCLVHHPAINQAVECIKQWMVAHQIIPYDEQTGKGELRYIQLVVERSSQKIQASFVVNMKEKNARWLDLLEALKNEGLWHSLWLNFNDRPTNTIFGKKWLKVYGEELVWEKFGQTEICYLPSSFGQANLDLFAKMLARIHQWIPVQATVVEYFAGVGAIGLYIVDKCAKIVCEEANPETEYCFNQSKERFSDDLQKKISYCNLPAEEALHLMDEADCVIVDPPRKGLTLPFKQALTKSKAEQLIYVSCGWESFKRDCHDLMQQGWQLAELEGYSFFPGSGHIELLARFAR